MYAEEPDFRTNRRVTQRTIKGSRAARSQAPCVQLCLLRYPGQAWLPGEHLPSEMLGFIAGQIGAEPSALANYAQRDETRREHQRELLSAFGWKAIDRLTYLVLARWLVEIAAGVDQSVSLLRDLLNELRRRRTCSNSQTPGPPPGAAKHWHSLGLGSKSSPKPISADGSSSDFIGESLHESLTR